MEEDTLTLDKLACMNNVSVVPDCGFAPGIPNAIVGHMAKDRVLGLRDVRIYVGGIAANSAINKYGYVATWSLDDLFEEFIRPARFKTEHKIRKAMPLQMPLELVQIGSFIFESFVSDGLRSLLKMPEAENMVERTLRWPGHIEQIRNVMHDKKAFKEALSACKGRDMVVMKVDVDGYSYQMLLYGDENMTAMARATAGGLVAATEVVVKYNYPTGVIPVERFFRDPNKYNEYMKLLNDRGLFINGR
jgi:saccharopine dehydrogenase-like NADP-dependent oxidoreductase